MDDSSTEWIAIKEALSGLMFGTVHIVVQDGVIIQIERTEKRRLRRKSPKIDSGNQRGESEEI